jgi:CheY-like chemotaxis protein
MSNAPILYADDDENDVFFLKHAFAAAEVPNPILVMTDGQQAIDHLAAIASQADARHHMPCLVILDIKLPRKSGMEVLQWLRQASGLPSLPVIIFSSSARRDDIHNAYQLGANSFVVKPPGVEERTRLAKMIKGYWLDFNQSPSDYP